MTKYEIDILRYACEYVALWYKLLKQAGYKVTRTEEDYLYVETDDNNDWILETLFRLRVGIFEDARPCVDWVDKEDER